MLVIRIVKSRGGQASEMGAWPPLFWGAWPPWPALSQLLRCFVKISFAIVFPEFSDYPSKVVGRKISRGGLMEKTGTKNNTIKGALNHIFLNLTISRETFGATNILVPFCK